MGVKSVMLGMLPWGWEGCQGVAGHIGAGGGIECEADRAPDEPKCIITPEFVW